MIESNNNDNFIWSAKWIWNKEDELQNTWMCFRKTVELSSKPSNAVVNIAVDSKYWLWINNKLVVREGGLKRGPTPQDTYYDVVDITQFLQEGNNTFAVLAWYWGVDSSSHNSSGKGGLLFEAAIDHIKVISDHSWRLTPYSAFLPSEIKKMDSGAQPLSEWNINYDARFERDGWTQPSFDDSKWELAYEKGTPPCKPWNRLVKRTIPFWKDSELLEYKNDKKIFYGKTISETEIKCLLPSNLQVYPYFKVDAPEGKIISIQIERDWKTTVYITKHGFQEFEVPAWGNGNDVIYRFPSDIKIIEVRYRETGYDTETNGKFACDDPELETLWKKSVRSIYVNMRDIYMDCPDRERSQWPGDVANIVEQTFYIFDRKSDLLTRKFIMEMLAWRTSEGILWGAVPSGRFKGKYREFTAQTLAAISVGLNEYFVHTGDKATLSEAYPHVKLYLLKHWQVEEKELVVHRGPWEVQWPAGTQNWYDWGENQDWRLMDNCWYYIALKALKYYATILDNTDDLYDINLRLSIIQNGFDQLFWNGKHYISPNFKGEPDDRGNALAVYSGIAQAAKFPALREVFRKSFHSSIYMEKYSIEALCIMGYAQDAIHRLKSRFKKEIKSDYTTIPEHFGENSNHGWGAWVPLIMGKYVAGIYPLKPAYEVFAVKPQLAGLTHIHTVIQTVKGNIECEINSSHDAFSMYLVVPDHTKAMIEIPYSEFTKNKPDSNKICLNGINLHQHSFDGALYMDDNENAVQLNVNAGKWLLEFPIM